ncbi:extensin-like domain-containing protein [Loktanella sp. S4079]|uniref:extensin-like domain-containing protein n=1 Tax=Loktanella sp. S4079 TaxID=579483 RepID=UPI001EF4CB63|nr:extensin family protein [Loktanella sp. S4079]
MAAAFLFLALVGGGGFQLLTHPQTPLPSAWNPTIPLRIADPVTPLTGWKLSRAAQDPVACLVALDGFADVTPQQNREVSENCHIRNRVELSGVGQARLRAIETRCPIALRLAMWEQHSLQPAAQDLLGTSVAEILHIGSYNCRAMRTGSADDPPRMSTHATADAIDISGFTFADGRRVSLLNHWDDNMPEAAFLRQARDGACRFFKLTLSPDYNTLHADHFHLQSVGWGLCR